MMKDNPNRSIPLDDLLVKLVEAAALPFEQAHPIPAAVNHSQAFLEHERKTVFMRKSICIGRADEISNHGDFLTHDIAGAPILVVRQKNNQIEPNLWQFSRCLARVCAGH